MTIPDTQSFALENSRFRWILPFVKRYDHDKYWRRRAVVVDPASKVPLPLQLYYLYYIKRTDARHGCSFGTNLNAGAHFAAPPQLPHGPAGIFVGHDVRFGRAVRIFHQVTVAHGGGVIGDEVMLGAGAKVLAGVNIGARARIGANCVLVEDIPENASVVLPKPRILIDGKDLSTAPGADGPGTRGAAA